MNEYSNDEYIDGPEFHPLDEAAADDYPISPNTIYVSIKWTPKGGVYRPDGHRLRGRYRVKHIKILSDGNYLLLLANGIGVKLNPLIPIHKQGFRFKVQHTEPITLDQAYKYLNNIPDEVPMQNTEQPQAVQTENRMIYTNKISPKNVIKNIEMNESGYFKITTESNEIIVLDPDKELVNETFVFLDSNKRKLNLLETTIKFFNIPIKETLGGYEIEESLLTEGLNEAGPVKWVGNQLKKGWDWLRQPKSVKQATKANKKWTIETAKKLWADWAGLSARSNQPPTPDNLMAFLSREGFDQNLLAAIADSANEKFKKYQFPVLRSTTSAASTPSSGQYQQSFGAVPTNSRAAQVSGSFTQPLSSPITPPATPTSAPISIPPIDEPDYDSRKSEPSGFADSDRFQLEIMQFERKWESIYHDFRDEDSGQAKENLRSQLITFQKQWRSISQQYENAVNSKTLIPSEDLQAKMQKISKKVDFVRKKYLLHQIDEADGDRREPYLNRGIPAFLTQDMRNKLRQFGYDPERIANMTPEKAWEIINANSINGSEPTPKTFGKRTAPFPPKTPPGPQATAADPTTPASTMTNSSQSGLNPTPVEKNYGVKTPLNTNEIKNFFVLAVQTAETMNAPLPAKYPGSSGSSTPGAGLNPTPVARPTSAPAAAPYVPPSFSSYDEPYSDIGSTRPARSIRAARTAEPASGVEVASLINRAAYHGHVQRIEELVREVRRMSAPEQISKLGDREKMDLAKLAWGLLRLL